MARLAEPRFASPRLGKSRYPALLALVAILTLVQPLAVGAGPAWCRSDPTVKIGDRIGHIYVSSHPDILALATGPTRIRIRVPEGVETKVLHEDQGFGYGWDVEFVTVTDPNDVPTLPRDRNDRGWDDGRFAVEIVVFVPSQGDSLPLLVEFVDDAGDTAEKLGRTNQKVRFVVRF